MQLTSPVMQNEQFIPKRYTGSGENISPPLEWSDVPSHCREFILLCEDPDAPHQKDQASPFVHWVAYNISPATTALPEGLDTKSHMELPVFIDQGKNSMGEIGYAGPNPPVGHVKHHYIFTLYALDAELGLAPGISKENVMKAMKGHVISEAQLTGLYERNPIQ